MQQNGRQNSGEMPQVPPSINTHFMAGGALWSVDDLHEDVVRAITAFLLGNNDSLTLTANEGPITFSRELLKTWTVAWPQRKASAIQKATRQDAEVLKMHQGGR